MRRNFKPTHISTIWHWTNIVTGRASVKAKLRTLDKLAQNYRGESREHFRMALAQVLRSDRRKPVRRTAIELLAFHFDWHEIEWTFWLHERRCPQDISHLKQYEDYCKTKSQPRDDMTLSQKLLFLGSLAKAL